MKHNTREPKRRPHRRTGKPGHYPRFEPTQEQRTMVAQLAGLKVSWEELRKLVVNPRTNRPIAKTSFSRIFAQELEQARGKLKELIASGFYSALANGEAWALRLALKNVFHYSLENNSQLPVMDVEEQQQKRIEVVFCTPDPKPLPAPVLDVTPAQPQPQSPPYRPQSALPPPAPPGSRYSWMD
jgi:hypothetical protein